MSIFNKKLDEILARVSLQQRQRDPMAALFKSIQQESKTQQTEQTKQPQPVETTC